VSGESDSNPAPGLAAAAPAQHILWDQLPENLGRDIIALKAEEHYTRVYTGKGEALVLMRFRDAVALLEDLGGVQTHRSYWVNPAYVEKVVREGRSSFVQLRTGQEIPISRSYRVMALRALGDPSVA
jgi:DNA-binding LytR/AlgR family response regulator